MKIACYLTIEYFLQPLGHHFEVLITPSWTLLWGAYYPLLGPNLRCLLLPLGPHSGVLITAFWTSLWGASYPLSDSTLGSACLNNVQLVNNLLLLLQFVFFVKYSLE